MGIVNFCTKLATGTSSSRPARTMRLFCFALLIWSFPILLPADGEKEGRCLEKGCKEYGGLACCNAANLCTMDRTACVSCNASRNCDTSPPRCEPSRCSTCCIDGKCQETNKVCEETSPVLWIIVGAVGGFLLLGCLLILGWIIYTRVRRRRARNSTLPTRSVQTTVLNSGSLNQSDEEIREWHLTALGVNNLFGSDAQPAVEMGRLAQAPQILTAPLSFKNPRKTASRERTPKPLPPADLNPIESQSGDK